MASQDTFGTRTTIQVAGEEATIYRVGKLEEDGVADVSRLPYSIKVLLEAALRQCDGFENIANFIGQDASDIFYRYIFIVFLFRDGLTKF